MNTSANYRNHLKRQRFRRVHRWVGTSVFVFLLFLSITGIFLNHTDGLRLDERYVDWPWLLDAYGLETPEATASFAGAGHRATQLGSRTFLDGRELDVTLEELRGMVVVDPLVFVGGSQTAAILTLSGELVEHIELASGPIKRVGRAEGRVVLETESSTLVRADDELTTFEPWDNSAGSEITWSGASAPTAAELESLDTAWRGRGITIERFILDLHSGRVLGGTGAYLMDIIAVFLIVMSLTGLFLTRARNRRQNGSRGSNGSSRS